MGWHSVIAKDHPLVRRNRNAQLSSHQQLYRWYCHGHFNIVKSRPRWRHNWRYAPSPCRALPWIPWKHVLAIQMVNVYPQSSTNTIWRSAVWFFKPDSVNIQANFFWNWYCLFENLFFCIKCKERLIDCTSALMLVLSILRLSSNAIELQTVS